MNDPEALLLELARTLSRGAKRPASAIRAGARDVAGEGGAEPAAAPAGAAPRAGGGSFARRERRVVEEAPSLFESHPPRRGAEDEPVAEGAIRARRSARVALSPPADPELGALGRRADAGATARLPFGEVEGTRDGAAAEPAEIGRRESLSGAPSEARARPEHATRPRWRRHPGLLGSAAFETFAVDEENQLAYRAVLESAQRPGALAKLVFLHGARGTGKSHLLRACVQVLAARGLRVVKRDAERLTHEFTSALAEGRVNALFDGLSGGDALLLDEVHRVGQRKATRAFVARVLLRYVESGRLVLLASRHHPRHIHGLEERQISLFLSGFSVQVRPPADAAKERWLRQRHRLLTGEDPPRELHRLSRAIRGGLGDLAAAHDRFLFGAEIEELAGLFGEGMPAVIAATAERLSIEPAQLGERASSRALSRARDVASHVALRLGYRAEIVGRHLGGRRPQTVRAAARRIGNALEGDAEIRAVVEGILMRLSG